MTTDNKYKHLRSHCVAWLQGGIGCPDCYDFICDVCGKKHNSMESHTLKTEQLSGVVMCKDCSGGNTTDRVEEDILDDEDERLYDRLIKEIIAECHSETLDWDEDRMRARLRRVLETT
jgi:transcription elongation factor Elf1